MALHSKEQEEEFLDAWLAGYTSEVKLYDMIRLQHQDTAIGLNTLHIFVRASGSYVNLGSDYEHCLRNVSSARLRMASKLIEYYAEDEWLPMNINLVIGSSLNAALIKAVGDYEYKRAKQFIVKQHLEGNRPGHIMSKLENSNGFKNSKDAAKLLVNVTLDDYVLMNSPPPEPIVEVVVTDPFEDSQPEPDNIIREGDWFRARNITSMGDMKMTLGKAYQCTRFNLESETCAEWPYFIDDTGHTDYHTPDRFTKIHDIEAYVPPPSVEQEVENFTSEVAQIVTETNQLILDGTSVIEPTNSIQEPIMAKQTNVTLVVSAAAFATKSVSTIYGSLVEDMNEGQLFDALKRVQGDQKALEELGTHGSSKRIVKQISLLKEAKKSIIAAIDELSDDE